MNNHLVSTIDLNLVKSELKSLISDVKLEIAFVVDVNHDSDSYNQLGRGDILAKSFSSFNSSELIDVICKPINPNISQYPLAGEYVLYIKHQLGNYYLSTINLSDNVNNNIDLSSLRYNVKYSDDDNLTKSPISTDETQYQSVLEKNKGIFSNSSSLRSYDNLQKFGDVTLHGRFGNSLKFSHDSNNQPKLSFINGNSIMDMSIGDIPYTQTTQLISFNKSTQSKIGSTFDNNLTFLSSDRLLFTANDGILVESPNFISFLTDDDFTIDSANNISLNSELVFLGYNPSEESLDYDEQSVILGSDFLKSLKQFVNVFEKFTKSTSFDTENAALKISSDVALNSISRLGWDETNIEKTFDRYLSKKVFLK